MRRLTTLISLFVGLGCGSDPIETSDTSRATTATTSATTDAVSDVSGDVTVTFVVTVPPETTAGPVTIEVDGRTTESSITLASGAITWVVRHGDQVELDDAGAPVVHHDTVTDDVTLSAEVRRWGPPGGRSEADVAFLVRVPAGTDSTTGLWISGNQPALGDWDGAGLRLERAQGDYWAAVLTTARSTQLEYKVTRGAWSSVEKGPFGEEVANRGFGANAPYARVTIDVARWADDPSTTPTGDGRIEILDGIDSDLVSDRDVIVWLPPGYDAQSTRRYPVLYMHDGQNLMDAGTSAFGEWYVDETAEALVLAGQVEPLIIVGPYNTNDRIPDYTPTVDSEYGGGDADDYGRYLIEELKPIIDDTFRTRPEAAHTGLAGSSLGGLVSMYLGLEHADVFGRAGVISPSVWWDGGVILDLVVTKVPLRVWLDIGSAEGGGESVGDTEALRDRLIQKGWVLGTDLAYTVYQGAGHNEGAWAERFDDVLRWLYPPAP